MKTTRRAKLIDSNAREIERRFVVHIICERLNVKIPIIAEVAKLSLQCPPETANSIRKGLYNSSSATARTNPGASRCRPKRKVDCPRRIS
jgi:hypothetical protein